MLTFTWTMRVVVLLVAVAATADVVGHELRKRRAHRRAVRGGRR